MKNYKHEIFLLLLAFMAMAFTHAKACDQSIPLSYAPTFLAPPVSGHYMKCEAKPDEQCLCIDGIEPWYAELVDELNENNEVIGKKLINSGPKRDAYLATKEAERIAALADEVDKRNGCNEIKELGAALDAVNNNIPSTVTTVSALRQEINAKMDTVAQALKKVKRCLK